MRLRSDPWSAARLALAALLLAASGCGEGFPPFNRIQELRVLAIRSDPVAPEPGETTSLSALVYTPNNDPSVSYAWSWCPLPGAANDGYPCLIDEAQLAAMAGAAGQAVPPYDLGTAPTAELPHAINPLILQQLCAAAGSMVVGGTPLDPDYCNGGFPIQIKLRVKTATDEVLAIRRLRLRLAPGGEPNTNPRIDGIFRVILDENGNETSREPIEETPQVTLFRAKDAELRAEVPLESSEPYTGKDDDRRPIATRERLTLAWFVETGSTKDAETNYVEGLNQLSRALENEWEPGRVKDYPRGTARLILVLRDNRDGVSWRSGTVLLGEPE